MPQSETIKKAKKYLVKIGWKDLTDSNMAIWFAEFAEQFAKEDCFCEESETTGATTEWVCNNCGRMQKQ